MKHIKVYEEIKYGYPKIGDYVVCIEDADELDPFNKSLVEFQSENIGEVVDYRNKENLNSEFDGVPENYDIFVKTN